MKVCEREGVCVCEGGCHRRKYQGIFMYVSR